MSRKETKTRIPHMLIDTDFYEKPENLEAIEIFGDIAPAAIQRICFKLINEREASLKKSQVLAMWMSTGTKKETWIEIIEYYIKCGWLIEENGNLSSARVKQERARVENKRSILSANAQQKHSKSKANEQQSTSISSDTDTDTELDINKISLTGKYKTPEIQNALIAFRSKIKKYGRKLDQIQVEALCMRFKSPERLLEALTYTNSLSEARNVIEPPDKPPPKYPDKNTTVPFAESKTAAAVAQRERDAKEKTANLRSAGIDVSSLAKTI